MPRGITKAASYALSRPIAYAVVVLVFAAVVVSIVGGWPLWTIAAAIAGGLLILLLLVVDALGSPNTERQYWTADIEPSRLRDKRLRAKVERAMEYVRAANELAKPGSEQADMSMADDELPQMEQAAISIYKMALRLQEYWSDSLIQRDVGSLQRDQSRGAVLSESQASQWASLRRLGDVVAEAEQEIDGALAQLGKAYVEMKAIAVTPSLRGQASAALQQLGESARKLGDLMDGYDAAYGEGQARRTGPRG